MTDPRSNYAVVLKKAKNDTHLRLDKALQATAVEAIELMIYRTPVDTGAAKYHWFVRPLAYEKFDPDDVDASGQKPTKRAKRDIKLFKIGMELWLVNSAPYMTYLERGSSSQAPNGIVDITMATIDNMWQRQMKASYGHEAKAL